MKCAPGFIQCKDLGARLRYVSERCAGIYLTKVPRLVGYANEWRSACSWFIMACSRSLSCETKKCLVKALRYGGELGAFSSLLECVFWCVFRQQTEIHLVLPKCINMSQGGINTAAILLCNFIVYLSTFHWLKLTT